jgi:hypothetical protein
VSVPSPAAGTRFATPFRKLLLHLADGMYVTCVRNFSDEKLRGKSKGGWERGIPPFKKRRGRHPAPTPVGEGQLRELGIGVVKSKRGHG